MAIETVGTWNTQSIYLVQKMDKRIILPKSETLETQYRQAYFHCQGEWNTLTLPSTFFEDESTKFYRTREPFQTTKLIYQFTNLQAPCSWAKNLIVASNFTCTKLGIWHKEYGDAGTVSFPSISYVDVLRAAILLPLIFQLYYL